MTKQLQLYCEPDRAELMRTGYGTQHGEPTGMFIDRFGGWQWVCTDGKEYRTDRCGDGLWQLMPNGYEWQQELGTCQFSLPADRAKARRKLQRSRYELAEETP